MSKNRIVNLTLTKNKVDLEKYAPNIVEGISKIKDWSNSL